MAFDSDTCEMSVGDMDSLDLNNFEESLESLGQGGEMVSFDPYE